MKSKIILSLLVTAMYGTSALAADEAMSAPATPTAASAPAPASAPNAATAQSQQQDGEVLAVLITLNNNEIAAAKLAAKKASLPMVKRYAHVLDHDHAKNLKETLKLSKKIKVTPVETATVTTLKNDGQTEMSALSPLTNKDFDKAYIDAMVKDHTAALQLIDNTLAKNVVNAALKKHLMTTRDHIATHLKKAQEIQVKIDAAANKTAPKS